MSDEADYAVVEDPTDNLDCFNFALLLDDVSLSNKRQRKQSMMTDDQQVDGSTGGFDHTGSKPLGSRPKREQQVTTCETRSECMEPRKFNIWGDHTVDRESVLVAHFAGKANRKMSNQRMINPGMSYTDSKAARFALELLDDDEDEMQGEKLSPDIESEGLQINQSKPAASTTSQKRKLKFSKNEGYYPNDFDTTVSNTLQVNGSTTTYRKLSYQETPQVYREPDNTIDIRARLNLDVLFNFTPGLGSRTTSTQTKFAQYVRDDIHGLFERLGSLLDQRLQVKTHSEFPNPRSIFGGHLQGGGAVVHLSKKH